MTDNEAMRRTAETWIACGGDATGMEYCWRLLRDEIATQRADKEQEEQA